MSGYLCVISSIFLEKMRISPLGRRWICARWPSYLYSAAKLRRGGWPPDHDDDDDADDVEVEVEDERALRALAISSATDRAGFASIGCGGQPAVTTPTRATCVGTSPTVQFNGAVRR